MKGASRGVGRRNRIVHLEGRDGDTSAWKPSEIGRRRGGTEVYRAEIVEVCTGAVAQEDVDTRIEIWR